MNLRNAVQFSNHAVNLACSVAAPITTYTLAHHVWDPTAGFLQPATPFIAGGLLYSASTVYDWLNTTLKHRGKAIGFMVLIEGAMTFINLSALTLCLLALLVAINVVGTCTTLKFNKPARGKPDVETKPADVLPIRGKKRAAA